MLEIAARLRILLAKVKWEEALIVIEEDLATVALDSSSAEQKLAIELGSTLATQVYALLAQYYPGNPEWLEKAWGEYRKAESLLNNSSLFGHLPLIKNRILTVENNHPLHGIQMLREWTHNARQRNDLDKKADGLRYQAKWFYLHEGNYGKVQKKLRKAQMANESI